MKRVLLVAVLVVSLSGCGGGRYVLDNSSCGLRLSATPAGQDVALELVSRGGEDTLAFRLSELAPVSTVHPWDLRPQRFSRVSCRMLGDTLLVSGTGDKLETSLRFSLADSLVRVKAVWRNQSPDTLTDLAVALALSFDQPPAGERLTLPHILYNGNPSSAPERLVPRFGPESTACLVCEETRFPIPCVNLEWQTPSHARELSLFSLPDSAAGWSLGVDRSRAGLRILCASGVLALNGVKDATYGGQCRSLPLEVGYASFAPGMSLAKTAFIQLGQPLCEGQGFRAIVPAAWSIFQPHSSPCLGLDSVVALKANALAHRWHEDSRSAGFLAVLPGNYFKRPPYFLCGWSGQNLRLAWCSAKLGLETGAPELVGRCNRAVDFFIRKSATKTPGLHWNYYMLDTGAWEGDEDEGRKIVSSRATGEYLTNLGHIIRLYREAGQPVPQQWTDFLRQGADFLLRDSSRLPGGIYPVFWNEDGTPESDFESAAGIPCVRALLEAWRVCGDSLYLKAAQRDLERYWSLNGDRFDRPFARSTLDARCEDKEAGLYFFLAASEMFAQTGDSRYRAWAEASADWILTYVFFWNTGFRPESYCGKKGFVSTGWPGVSVQNHHLDVYFPAWELHEFGLATGNRMYAELGRMVFDAWSHGICRYPGDWEHQTPGEQGEQFYQTNYGITPEYWRGGYHYWNPSWIVALVLEAGLRFKYEG
ncbi:hypothetical protein LLH00_03200 [bacterium]|nr:hypothetical protein [bacterium]